MVAWEGWGEARALAVCAGRSFGDAAVAAVVEVEVEVEGAPDECLSDCVGAAAAVAAACLHVSHSAADVRLRSSSSSPTRQSSNINLFGFFLFDAVSATSHGQLPLRLPT